MLSRTSEYALRAVLFLSRASNGATQSAASVSTALGVPRNYLSKVLNRLARRGVVESVRGRGGGFRLAKPADALAVSDIVAEFDERGSLDGCVLAERACDASSPCEAHEKWAWWSGELRRLMDGTMVADFLPPGGEGGRENDGGGEGGGVNERSQEEGVR